MRTKLAGVLAALALLLTFAALPQHAAASGCCMEANVYFDGGPDSGNASPQSICLYGYNQNWSAVYDCAWNVYPIYTHTYSFPNYWWQSGCCEPGTSYGYVDVLTYYTDGTYTWVNAVVPYQSNCYGASYFLVFSNEGITSC